MVREVVLDRVVITDRDRYVWEGQVIGEDETRALALAVIEQRRNRHDFHAHDHSVEWRYSTDRGHPLVKIHVLWYNSFRRYMVCVLCYYFHILWFKGDLPMEMVSISVDSIDSLHYGAFS